MVDDYSVQIGRGENSVGANLCSLTGSHGMVAVLGDKHFSRNPFDSVSKSIFLI